MLYGKEKHLQMARSILPSNARKTAKQRKDRLHRINRRQAKMALHKIRDAEDYLDDEFDFTAWVEPHRNEYDDIVFDRRMADKLHHFEFWAYQVTKHLRPEDRMSHLRALLPGDLISFHAMTHLRFLEPPHDSNSIFRFDLPYRLRPGYRSSWNRSLQRDQVMAAVKAIARDDAKRKRFNDYLVKNARVDVFVRLIRHYDQRPEHRWITWTTEEVKEYFEGSRTLNGYHDVYKFVRDIFAATRYTEALGYHPSWLELTKQYFGLS